MAALLATTYALQECHESTISQTLTLQFSIGGPGTYYHRAQAPASGSVDSYIRNMRPGNPVKSHLQFSGGVCESNSWNTTGDLTPVYQLQSTFVVNSGRGWACAYDIQHPPANCNDDSPGGE